ncbi:MAG: glycerophosphodiester phosphodiesterase family protein [Gammaproteobacteria bacterium]
MKDRLVAHRGDMATYPENSLLALCAAAKLGFKYIELDIQLSKDNLPIVIHDDNLVRTTGINKSVYESSSEYLLTQRVLTPLKDKESQSLLNLTTLERTVEVLNSYPDITLFVEIKRQCLEHLSVESVVEVVLKNLVKAKFNIVVISFVRQVVEHAKKQGNYPVGWVLTDYDQEQLKIVNTMQPNYIFCNVKKINRPSELWKGSWKWVLYDIMNPSFAYELLEQGVDLIETGDIVKLNASEYFSE